MGCSRKGIVRITVIILWTLQGIPHILPEAILLNFTHTHFYKQKTRGIGHANLLNFATIFFLFMADTLAFLTGRGVGLREEKLDAEAKPM